MGNEVSEIIDDVGEFVVNTANTIGTFFEEEVFDPIEDTFNNLFGTDIEQLPPQLQPPNSIIIVENSHVDSHWSKISRAIFRTFELNIKSDSNELRKKYANMNENYEITDKDNRTLLINIDECTFRPGTKIVIYCRLAGIIHPMLIFIHESLINDVILIGVNDLNSIFSFSYERTTNTMTYIDPKNLLGQLPEIQTL